MRVADGHCVDIWALRAWTLFSCDPGLLIAEAGAAQRPRAGGGGGVCWVCWGLLLLGFLPLVVKPHASPGILLSSSPHPPLFLSDTRAEVLPHGLPPCSWLFVGLAQFLQPVQVLWLRLLRALNGCVHPGEDAGA